MTEETNPTIRDKMHALMRNGHLEKLDKKIVKVSEPRFSSLVLVWLIVNQSINQSIAQPHNQPTNQSINQSINRSIKSSKFYLNTFFAHSRGYFPPFRCRPCENCFATNTASGSQTSRRKRRSKCVWCAITKARRAVGNQWRGFSSTPAASKDCSPLRNPKSPKSWNPIPSLFLTAFWISKLERTIEIIFSQHGVMCWDFSPLPF